MIPRPRFGTERAGLAAAASHAVSRQATHRLEERITPSTTPPLLNLGAGYWGNNEFLALYTRPDAVVVSSAAGNADTLTALTTGPGPLAGFTIERKLTSDLVILSDPNLVNGPFDYERLLQDRLEGAARFPGVEFAVPVFVNPKTGAWAVATDELIVRLQPGLNPTASFAADPRIAGWTPLSGTPDQFVVRVAAGAGQAALSLNHLFQNDSRFAWSTPNFYQSFERFYKTNDPLVGNQWHLNNANDADVDGFEAWDITPGGSQNIVVSIIDDGLDITHPDLAPNIAINPNEIPAAIKAVLVDVDGDGIITFLDLNNAVNQGSGKITDLNGNGRIDPGDILKTTAQGGWADGVDTDGNGWVDDFVGWDFTTNGTNGDNDPGADSTNDKHATSVGGVTAARGDNALGVAGIAYRSRLQAIRIFGSTGSATTDANIASSIYYAAGRTKNGLSTFRSSDITNNSWGGGSFSTAIKDAFQWASTNGREGKGAASFIATGNGGNPFVAFPANLAGTISGVIAVGASTNTDVRSGYSQYGPEIDFLAPSNGGSLSITTTDRVGSAGYSSGDYTSTFGGTSSATPLASGVGALVLALDPNLTPAQLRGLLRNTTDFIGPTTGSSAVVYDAKTGFNNLYGYGRVNAFTAVSRIGKAEIQVVEGRTNIPSGGSPLTFANTSVGNVSASRIFRIRNQGTAPLTIGTPFFSGPFEFDLPLGIQTIPIGGSAFFSIRFRPLTPGTFNGSLTFSTNDADEGTFVIPLAGVGLAPAFEGVAYEDWNGNGVRDTNDPLLSGRRIYIDANNNGTFDQPTNTFSSGTINLTIPDNNPTGVTANLNVTGLTLPILSVTVTMNITHTWVGDLEAELIGPGGTPIVMLVDNRGGSGDNFTNTTFDDDAATPIAAGTAPFTGTFRPEQPLAAFAGIANGNGTWGLRVRDIVPADVGKIVDWTLKIKTSESSVLSAPTGEYSFPSQPNGTYHLRETQPTGWVGTGPVSGKHTVTFSGTTISNLDFGSARKDSVYGQVIFDEDSDGIRDPGEVGIADRIVFDDRNGNGVLDAGEASAKTDAFGNYRLSGLAVGTTTIRLQNKIGSITTFPAAGHSITMTPGAVFHNKDFLAFVDVIPPTVTIEAVTPNPRNSPVNSLAITFSEPVTGFQLSDLSLSRNGTFIDLSSATLSGSGADYLLSGLAPLTGGDGNFQITLIAETSGIVDAAQNPLTDNGSSSWVSDVTPPTGEMTPIAPNPRNTPVGSVAITFLEPVTGLDVADFSLTLDGVPVALGSAIVTGSGTNFALDNLTGLTGAHGKYLLTLLPGGYSDIVGNPAVEPIRIAWTMDTKAPIGIFDTITPNPRNTPLNTVSITFNEAVTGLALSDFQLFFNSAPIGFGKAIFYADGNTFVITNLKAVTGATGTYKMFLPATGTGITDLVGNPFTTDASIEWVVDTTAPTIALQPLTPNPRNTPATSIPLDFSEAVTGLDLADLSLTKNGVAVPLSGASLTPTSKGYLLTMPASLTAASGNYVLTVNAAGAGITDLAGNPLTTGGSITWTTDADLPTVTLAMIEPGIRNTAVDQVPITFSEPITGLSLSDFTLTRDNLPVPLTNAVLTGSGANYILSGLAPLQLGDGEYSLTLRPGTTFDVVGNSLFNAVSTSWTLDTVRPILSVPPGSSSITEPFDALSITASEALFGFDVDDLRLALNGVAISTTGLQLTGSGSTYALFGWQNVLTKVGTYTLQVPLGASVADAAGNRPEFFSLSFTITRPSAPPVAPLPPVAPPTAPTKDVREAYALGADAGGGPVVTLFNLDGTPRFTTFAYDPAFFGGVRTAVGDVTGDGFDDLITAPGFGGGPDIRVLDGKTGRQVRQFFAFGADFFGGVYVAVGDVNGDGVGDIVAGAGVGGGPHIRVFDGKTGNEIGNFFAFDPNFRGGVTVAVGDIDGDGTADIVVGAASLGGPRVTAFRGTTLRPFLDFFAYDPSFTGGVFVSVGDLDGDGKSEIVTGTGVGGGPHVKAFNALGDTVLSFFDVDLLSSIVMGGVRVSAVDVTGDGKAEVLTASGPGLRSLVQARSTDGSRLRVFAPFAEEFIGGIFIS